MVLSNKSKTSICNDHIFAWLRVVIVSLCYWAPDQLPLPISMFHVSVNDFLVWYCQSIFFSLYQPLLLLMEKTFRMVVEKLFALMMYPYHFNLFVLTTVMRSSNGRAFFVWWHSSHCAVCVPGYVGDVCDISIASCFIQDLISYRLESLL